MDNHLGVKRKLRQLDAAIADRAQRERLVAAELRYPPDVRRMRAIAQGVISQANRYINAFRKAACVFEQDALAVAEAYLAATEVK